MERPACLFVFFKSEISSPCLFPFKPFENRSYLPLKASVFILISIRPEDNRLCSPCWLSPPLLFPTVIKMNRLH